jgi:hypothetical protein
LYKSYRPTHLVVDKVYVLPADLLQIVLVLFHFEDVSHEELLQMFIRIIDAQLFEAVMFEILKTEDIQHADTTDDVLLTWSARRGWAVGSRLFSPTGRSLS